MGKIRPSSVVCCDRQDESRYFHACACPSISRITQSKSKTATLCGHSEYTGDGIEASVPPKKYLKEIIDIKKNTSSIDVGVYCSEQTTESQTGQCEEEGNSCTYTFVQTSTTSLTSAIKTSENSFESKTLNIYSNECVFSSNYSENSQPSENYNVNEVCEDIISTGRDSEDLIIEGPYKVLTTISTTEKKLDYQGIQEASFTRDVGTTKLGTQAGSCFCLISDSRTEQTLTLSPLITTFLDTYNLSEEDTDEAALERAEEASGTSNSSIWQTRSTGFSFIKRTVKFAALLKDLCIGAEYEGGIPLQSREAITGESTTLEDESDISIPKFRADKKFKIVGGTLNVSEAEFIENNYSTNPSTYGLDADEFVITANTDLPHEQGYEFVLGTPYVEKSP